ncbi:MAG: glycosyltransferase family 39 protein [Gammaproteobacteria bacterium]|nr:glycosyltransferase family 39 protein [Gammaproteobacteria bacterium]
MLFSLSKTNLNAKQSWVIDVLGLIVLLGLFYAIWIGSHALVTPDEGRYSEVAREMVVSGDYITPRLNGVAFLDKPVLYYWLQASAIKMFGLAEWSLRFWPALIGILGCLVTYITGRVLFDRRTGILSAIILATSPLYYGGSHYTNLDLEVASLISNSLLCFIAAMHAGSSRVKKYLLIAAYIFAGLAALTKGLIGIVFPMMIIGSWIVLLNRWDTILKMRLLMGMVIFFVITVPWYVLVQKANPEFLHFFFVTQQVSRFLTTQDFNSKAAVWFYVPVVLAGLFPWSVFLIQSLVQKIKLVWGDRKHHPVELYLLLWFFIVLVFFSIPRSKTVGYILPIFPVSALLIGSYLNQVWHDAKKIRALSTAFLIFSGLIGAGLFMAPAFNLIEIPPVFLPYLRAMGLIILFSGMTGFFVSRQKSMAPLFACSTVTIVLVLLTFVASTPFINDKSVKPIALTLKPNLQPNDEVVTFYKYYQDLPIYLERRITIVADWHAADIPHKDNWLREMWYGMVFQDTKDWLIEEAAFWQRWNSEKRVFVITDDDNYNKLSRKTHVYKIQQENNMVLLSNKA